MTTTALNNLATYILSLGLSQRNRKWLAERIMETGDMAYSPNDDTLAAMKEIENGHDAGKVDMSSVDAFIASMQ